MRKLTQKDVIKIRSRAAAGERQKDIAADYGISQGHVSLLVRFASWKFGTQASTAQLELKFPTDYEHDAPVWKRATQIIMSSELTKSEKEKLLKSLKPAEET